MEYNRLETQDGAKSSRLIINRAPQQQQQQKKIKVLLKPVKIQVRNFIFFILSHSVSFNFDFFFRVFLILYFLFVKIIYFNYYCMIFSLSLFILIISFWRDVNTQKQQQLPRDTTKQKIYPIHRSSSFSSSYLCKDGIFNLFIVEIDQILSYFIFTV